MNIARSFCTYLQDQGYGTFGTNLFIGSIPLTAPDSCYMVKSAGGNNNTRLSTGEKVKDYTLTVYYRSRDAEEVYEVMQALEELCNSNQCATLGGYVLIGMEALLFPADNDIDDEERLIGVLEVQITTYL